MAVPPTDNWMSRAKRPLVSVTMAWASETPGVRTPPTVVNAPYFRTCLRLSGLAMALLPGVRQFSLENERPGFYSSPITHEAPGFRVQGDEHTGSGGRHLRP